MVRGTGRIGLTSGFRFRNHHFDASTGETESEIPALGISFANPATRLQQPMLGCYPGESRTSLPILSETVQPLKFAAVNLSGWSCNRIPLIGAASPRPPAAGSFQIAFKMMPYRVQARSYTDLELVSS